MTPSTRGPAMLIVSPLASRIREAGARSRMTRAAVDALRARSGGEVEVVETGVPAEIEEAAGGAVRGGASTVVLAGGDGTVRDASRALAGTGVEVGILPCGTGNLYASAVGVPRDLRTAVAALVTGRVRPFDLGEVARWDPDGTPAAGRPAPFVVACGTGFDARIMAATTRDMKRRYGVAAYFLAASRVLGDVGSRPTVLTIDGERHELESLVVLVASCGEVIPGVLRPRLPIDPDDGLLHVFVLPRGGVIGGIRGGLELMLAESRGVSPSGHAIRLAGRHVRVEVAPPQPIQLDGDAYPPAVIEARILPGAMRVILP